MFRKFRKYFFIGLNALLLLIFAVIFGFKQNKREVEKILVDIDFTEGDYFIDSFDVMSLMSLDGEDVIEKKRVGDLNFGELEKRVEVSPFVQKTQVYSGLKGGLKVDVVQTKPMARIMQNNEWNYIDKEGRILPMSDKYTTRVLIVTNDSDEIWDECLTKTLNGRQIMSLVNYINASKFWKSQISQIHILKDMSIELVPQVTDQIVQFGSPVEIEKKLNKLITFYKDVMPYQGWNKYEKINIEYNNQVIGIK